MENKLQHLSRAPVPLVAAAGLVGGAAWCGHVWLLALTVLFPVLWFRSPSRTCAAFVSVAYHCGATIPLLKGASIFFGSGAAVSAVLWFVVSVLNSATWIVFWAKRERLRTILLPFPMLLTAVPPLGILSCVHPLAASGVLFPAFGVFGVLLCFALCCVLPVPTRALRVASLCLLGASFVAHVTFVPKVAPSTWAGRETSYSNNAASVDLIQQYSQQLEMLRKANALGGTVVFPENSAGEWNEATAALWRDRLKFDNQSVLLGAIELVPFTDYYNNVMVGVTRRGAQILYRQRVPIPVSMWQPWAGKGAIAHWIDTPVFEWKGKRVAPLICYEQCLVWPVLHALSHHPDVIVATGNLWWCRDTRLPRVQRALVRSWASLANIPVIEAFNQ